MNAISKLDRACYSYPLSINSTQSSGQSSLALCCSRAHSRAMTSDLKALGILSPGFYGEDCSTCSGCGRRSSLQMHLHWMETLVLQQLSRNKRQRIKMCPAKSGLSREKPQIIRECYGKYAINNFMKMHQILEIHIVRQRKKIHLLTLRQISRPMSIANIFFVQYPLYENFLRTLKFISHSGGCWTRNCRAVFILTSDKRNG